MARDKIYPSFTAAVGDISDGATVMIGGFGVAGDCPQNLIKALKERGTKNLCIITNTSGTGGKLAAQWWKMPYWVDSNLLVENKQVEKFICSITFPGTAAEKAILSGEVKIEYVPQGTLAERIRSGGFGIGGFYTRTGAGTVIAQGKETKIIDGDEYLFERPLKADYAFIKAYKADRYGNLIYRGNTRSFNVVMAPAANITIAEVDEIVGVGELDPEIIITPEIFVDRIVVSPKERK